jgi:hypothetical protein
MFVARNGALVCPKPCLPAHLEVHCRVTPGSHVANQLHLAFSTPIEGLLYSILESRHELQGARVQGSLWHIKRGRDPGMSPKEKK